jgi:DNA-3-methyladenine glycosylase II
VREALEHLSSADPIMAAIIERVGPYAVNYREPTFEALARSIVFQQLNGHAALTIFNRLLAAAGSPLTPEGVLRLRMPTLRRVGLSTQKATYIRDLAKRTAAGELDFSRMHEMSDDDVIAALTKVKGVGEWTAQMFLMFALRRPDVLPTLDYGVRAAMMKAYRLRKMPKPERMHQIARKWHPYRSVASWYLWRSLDPTVTAPDAGRPAPLPIEE